MKENDRDVIMCDSSCIYALKPIFGLLSRGCSSEALKKRIIKSGSSQPLDYYKGAVGLLLSAIGGEVGLVINPICFKELCIDGKKNHDRNIDFLFNSGLWYLAWPRGLQHFATKVKERYNKYEKNVGALRRLERYSILEKGIIDDQLEDKLSCAENDVFFDHGGYLIKLSNNYLAQSERRTTKQMRDAIVEEILVETRKKINIMEMDRISIKPKVGDVVLGPKDIYCHTHVNSADFGDKLTQSTTYYEINKVSRIANFSLGDLYRECGFIKENYDAYEKGKITISCRPKLYEVEENE